VVVEGLASEASEVSRVSQVSAGASVLAFCTELRWRSVRP